MSEMLHLRNRQRVRPLNLPLLRRLVRHLLTRHLQLRQFEVCFHFIARREMTRLNEGFLLHPGSTDVITFNHAGSAELPVLYGEIFISLDDAVEQAAEFHTTWPAELVRYLVHGMLHLLGHDDRQPGARRRMKRAEDRLLRLLAGEFPLARLARPRVSPTAVSGRFGLRKRLRKPRLAK